MTMTWDRLTTMLQQQSDFQMRLGHHFYEMPDEQRIAYVKDMMLALQSEVFEALNEVSWKPWATGAPRFDVDAFTKELTDIWHFLMNLWLVAMPHLHPDEIASMLFDSYQRKITVNHKRQDDGYDGVTGKCKHCGRAYDDQAPENTHCACGHLIVL